MIYFHDEFGCKEPGDLISDNLPLVLREAAEGLLDRLRIRPDVQRVLGELPRNTRHVLGGPCEDVPILTEEVDELAFLFAVQAGSDDDAFAWLGGVQRDLLCVLGRLERHVTGWLHSIRHILLQMRDVAHYCLLLSRNDQGLGDLGACRRALY